MKRATNGSGSLATARKRELGAAPRRPGWNALGFQPAGFGNNIENRSLVFGRKTVLFHPVGITNKRRPKLGYCQ
ncbi:MAG: hypothetical protein Q4G69_05555 [Planctomycetia bacterium]|nr:hypothetical protein [Planctomycetia bacterium]MDO5580579.1 hypothetical protein [Planctomycetia bacterium]